MLTVGYSTREHNPKFIEYLKKSSGFKKIEVIEKVNNGEKSLAKLTDSGKLIICVTNGFLNILLIRICFLKRLKLMGPEEQILEFILVFILHTLIVQKK